MKLFASNKNTVTVRSALGSCSRWKSLFWILIFILLNRTDWNIVFDTFDTSNPILFPDIFRFEMSKQRFIRLVQHTSLHTRYNGTYVCNVSQTHIYRFAKIDCINVKTFFNFLLVYSTMHIAVEKDDFRECIASMTRAHGLPLNRRANLNLWYYNAHTLSYPYGHTILHSPHILCYIRCTFWQLTKIHLKFTKKILVYSEKK